MAVYVVTWNLNREKPNYHTARQRFVDHLNTLENQADRYLDSVRFISTASSAANLEAYLRQMMDANDRLMVSMLRPGEYAGWLDRTVGTWIAARI
jgi:hypothetical protein